MYPTTPSSSPSPQPPLTANDHQIFASLKAQILSIATALYGTTSTTPQTAFDIITYSTPSPSPSPSYGIALITYPNPTSFTTWEILSQTTNHRTINAGVSALLDDLRAGMGAVMAELGAREVYTVEHGTVPDLACGRGEEEEEVLVYSEPETWNGNDGYDGERGVESTHRGRMQQKPRLSVIVEEVM